MDKWFYAIFTIVILGLFVWFIQKGTDDRPIIGYKFESECPKEINFNYIQDISEQNVGLGISNSGDTDASVILHFYGGNITISSQTKKPYNEINDTNVYTRFTASKDSPTYYYGERVYFKINKTIESFYYAYEVTKNPDKSISGNINKFFGEIKGFYPNHCKYKRESDKFVNII